MPALLSSRTGRSSPAIRFRKLRDLLCALVSKAGRTSSVQNGILTLIRGDIRDSKINNVEKFQNSRSLIEETINEYQLHVDNIQYSTKMVPTN
jgi:hypothetical protein